MTIIASNDKRWYPAYSVLVGYVVLCVLFVVAAPEAYVAHMPFSKSLAAASDSPSVVAFNIEAMWATFPVAMVAFSAFAPVKLKSGASRADIPATIVGCIVFSCAAMALLSYGILAKPDISSHTKAATMTAWAAHSKLGLACVSSFYFCCSLCMAWLAFVACPRSYLMLLSGEPNNSSKRTR